MTEQPGYPPRAAPGSVRRLDPRQVVLWARIYDAVLLVPCILGAAAGGVIMPRVAEILRTTAAAKPAPGDLMAADPLAIVRVLSGAVVVVTTVSLVAGLGAFLPPLVLLRPGRPAMWGWQCATLGVTLVVGTVMLPAGILMAVPAIVLFIYWLKPEVREYLAGPSSGG